MQRIDVDLADVLVRRLHSAGLSIHKALRMAEALELRQLLEKALGEIDVAITSIRVAARDDRGSDQPSG